MAWFAFVLYATGVLIAFGLRTWLHRRRTGDSGHRHSHPPVGSSAWWAQILLAAGLLGGLVTPLLDATGLLEPVAVLAHPPIQGAGLLVAVLGFVAIPAAQRAMGLSWRIGVDAGERTALVTDGVFGVVRNPVFAAMIVAVSGITAMTPTWAQLLVLAAMVAGIELQVRTVEEPYLRTIHGYAYADYLRRTGRFVPRVRQRGVLE